MNAPVRFDPGCFGKTAYGSKAEALLIKQFRDKSRHMAASRGRGGLEPYRCRSCNGWHLGSASFRAGRQA